MSSRVLLLSVLVLAAFTRCGLPTISEDDDGGRLLPRTDSGLGDDAGPSPDAGSALGNDGGVVMSDAGSSRSDSGAGTDAGASFDAGFGADGGRVDAGVFDAGGVDAGPGDAGAFDAGAFDAGFVNDAGHLIRVLFDGAHEQTAGNAYWLVDGQAPSPVPANPTTETDWSGAISAWGFGLYQSGRYSISQLPTGVSLNWGGGGPGDLSAYDVFISDEPELSFSATEQTALMSFANASKGIVMVSDHKGAARCGTCVEAWLVINDFLQNGAADAFGVKIDGNSIGGSGLTGTMADAGAVGAQFSAGPFGAATGLTYHSGSSVSLVAGKTTGRVVVNSTSGGMVTASELPSGGRLVLIGDSSPADDGTCSSCGSPSIYDGWSEGTDAQLILNATAWVAHE